MHNHLGHTSTTQGGKSWLWLRTERKHGWKAKLDHCVSKTKQVQSYQIFMLIGSKLMIQTLTTYLRDVTFVGLKRDGSWRWLWMDHHICFQAFYAWSNPLLNCTFVPCPWLEFLLLDVTPNACSKVLIHDFDIYNKD